MWQEYFFAASGVIYTVVLLPSCFDRQTEVPRSTSFLTMACMMAGGFVYGTLDMWIAGGFNLLGCLPWGFLLLFRPIRTPELNELYDGEE